MFALIMEAVSTPETSVNFYKTAWRNNSENSHLKVSFASLFVIVAHQYHYTYIFDVCVSTVYRKCGLKVQNYIPLEKDT